MKNCSKQSCGNLAQKQLWETCQKFIQDLGISCPESVYQSDRVSLNSLEFIEKVCGIVGYVQIQEED